MMKKELHREIMESVPLGYAYNQIILNNDGIPEDYVCLEMNELGGKLFGTTNKNFIGKNFSQSHGKMTKKMHEFASICGKVALGGGEITLQRFEIAPNRTLRVKIVSPEKGYFITYFTDISDDVKKIEELEALLNTLNDIIFIIDSQYVFKDVLTRDESLLFVPKNKIIGKSIHEIFDENATKYFLDAMNKSIESRKEEVLIYPSVNPNEKKWFRATIQTFGNNGNTNYIISISDITDRKNAEIDAEKYKNELEKQRSLQESIFELFSAFAQAKLEGSRKVVEKSLEKISKLIGVDRSFVFNYDLMKMTAKPIYLWVSQRYEHSVIDLNEVSLKHFQEWNDAHMNGESVYVNDINKIPEGDIKDALQKHDWKSFYTVPLIKGDYCYGFIGFESIENVKQYTEDEKLLLVKYAQILLAFIQRIEYETKLKEMKQGINQFFK